MSTPLKNPQCLVVLPTLRARGKRSRRLEAVGLVVLVASRGHAAQLVLSSELATEVPVCSHELLAHVDENLPRRDAAVGLDTDHDLGHVRVGHCGAREYRRAQN